ncbi:MAG: recombination-associated protein RdgC [Oleiphilus sp.]|nr:MAG: recombination-associated protein RdgC [Oleiphilus sp.]
MWFKNLTLYRFTKPFDVQPEQLEEQLSEALFKPCSANDIYQIGWVAPLGNKSENLIHVSDKFWMLCLCKQERILPSSVVNEQVQERCEEIENSQSRKVSRKEKSELKEQVTIELMPKAFTRTIHYFAYICPRDGYMVVNTASAKVADELTSFLRKTIGSLPIRPIEVNTSPSAVMTHWLAGKEKLSEHFELGVECELVSGGEEKAAVKYKGMDLDIEQIEQHIESGMLVDKLTLAWRENINFLLSSDLTIRRLKFSDLVQEKFDDIDTDDKASRFDASFSIMAMEIDQLIPDILDMFGGEDRSAILDK